MFGGVRCRNCGDENFKNALHCAFWHVFCEIIYQFLFANWGKGFPEKFHFHSCSGFPEVYAVTAGNSVVSWCRAEVKFALITEEIWLLGGYRLIGCFAFPFWYGCFCYVCIIYGGVVWF